MREGARRLPSTWSRDRSAASHEDQDSRLKPLLRIRTNQDESGRIRTDQGRIRANQVFLALLWPCSRVISERRKTLLKRNWHEDETCSINVELTRKIVTGATALIDA